MKKLFALVMVLACFDAVADRDIIDPDGDVYMAPAAIVRRIQFAPNPVVNPQPQPAAAPLVRLGAIPEGGVEDMDLSDD